jgi:hypothetical protein
MFLLILTALLLGCKTIETRTEISYILPEIPESIISPCEPIKNDSITTNGDLLMSYISLQTAYAICSSKIVSIRNILDSYNTVYSTDNNQ